MSTVVESPISTPVILAEPTALPLPVAAPLEFVQPKKPSWLSQQFQKAYISSFNLCLSELGWVPTRVLEIGSGDGSLLAHLAQQFTSLQQVVGVEIDKDKVALAKERSCCSMEYVHLEEGESLPYPDNHFDLVVCHGFLGETELPRFWMSEMTRVSAEALIISVPSNTGFKISSFLPWAKDISVSGKAFKAAKTKPVPAERLQAWFERHKLIPRLNLSPLPYNMVLARKAQPAA